MNRLTPTRETLTWLGPHTDRSAARLLPPHASSHDFQPMPSYQCLSQDSRFRTSSQDH